MGGLISRFYIQNLMKDSPDGKPIVRNLIMLGTPNQGSPWADIMFDKFKENGHHVEALRELKTDVCRTFNSQVTNRKGVKFAIVYTDKIPFTGDTLEPGDGVVSYSSAVWQISDVSRSDSLEHTALTGKEDFIRFVYPRLALGPKKAKLAASLNKNLQNDQPSVLGLINNNWLASADSRALSFIFQTKSANSVTLKPNETLEMQIPTSRSKRGGITFFAPPNISATLTDASGEVLGESPAETPEASALFRYIVVAKPVAAESWKLKLENTSEAESLVVVVPIFDTNRLALEFTEIQLQPNGGVKLQAKFTDNGAAVGNAILKAKISGQSDEVAMFDDGKHGDGAANDGVYGVTTAKLPDGENFIEVKASTNGASVSTATVLSIGQ
jgi:hypothetical protein